MAEAEQPPPAAPAPLPVSDGVPHPTIAAPRLPSRRLRNCTQGVGQFLTNLFAPIISEDPPGEEAEDDDEDSGPVIPKYDENGRRLKSDGTAIVRPEGVKVALAKASTAKPDETPADRLHALGIDTSKGALSYLSPTRLAFFEASLDEAKKHILRKAPNVATTLASDLLKLTKLPKYMLCQVPWGGKRNGSQSATLRMKVVDPPFEPHASKKKAGELRLCVETEQSGTRWVMVTGAMSSTGQDNLVKLNTNFGDVLLLPPDEPTRWTWLLAANAGLHRASPLRCMLDQAAVRGRATSPPSGHILTLFPLRRSRSPGIQRRWSTS
jgi:hypothetical protein